MLEELGKKEGNAVYYQMIGCIVKDDHQSLVVEDLVEQSEGIRLLLDMEQFERQEGTWGAEIRLGNAFRRKIAKLAVVGDKRWERWLATLIDPFHAAEASFFKADEMEQAWAGFRNNMLFSQEKTVSEITLLAVKNELKSLILTLLS